MTEAHLYDILLVEDDPADVLLVRKALKRGAVPARLYTVGDGAEALAFLRRQAPFEHACRPALVLLDLNLPRVHGFEVLAEVKVDQDLKHIPVLVLTTSRDKADVNRAYDLYANCYLTKPVDLDDFYGMTGAIHEFWLRWASLPTRPLE